MEQMSKKKLISLIVLLFICIVLVIVSFYNLSKDRDRDIDIPATLNVEYINEIYSGSVHFTELIYSEEIEEGYLCLLKTSTNELNFAYLEQKKDMISYSVKSRASIDPSTLGSDYSIYDTLTPLMSLYGNNKFCFSVFTEPDCDTVTVNGYDIPVHQFDFKIGEETKKLGFWVMKASLDEDIEIE
ncbi:MAG: hypothetical protein E7647_00400 [Ruminococcaceae bacterium]|nr:hypothetical protein [Oscillospiraceae bacterium]